jgi:hypothetical protein
LRQIFLINVGVNASHGNLRSPIFEDCTFEFVPIPEEGRRVSCPECPTLPRYKDLTTSNGIDIIQIIPKSYHDSRVHNDPEFISYTYGDYPTSSPRAANLKKAETGDFLFFLARLVSHNHGSFGKGRFYLIGYFEIENILKEVRRRPDEASLRKFGKNAHVRRALFDERFWDGFWVFKGSEKSQRFKRAIPFDKGFCDSVLLDADGKKLVWPKHRGELQIIGSYTRACRIVSKRQLVAAFWKNVHAWNDHFQD